MGNYILPNTCTVQRRNGDFCNGEAWPLAPFPICFKHALKLRDAFDDNLNERIRARQRTPEENERWRRATEEAEEIRKANSVVYYARINDVIKIGFTVDLKVRTGQLRLHQKDILATEPGGRELENTRHRQFAGIRIDKRENFKMTSALIHHIQAVREYHGPPVFRAPIGPASVIGDRAI